MLHIKFRTKHNCLKQFLHFPRAQVPHSSELPICYDGWMARAIKIVLQQIQHSRQSVHYPKHLYVHSQDNRWTIQWNLTMTSYWKSLSHTCVKNARYSFTTPNVHTHLGTFMNSKSLADITVKSHTRVIPLTHLNKFGNNCGAFICDVYERNAHVR